MISKMIFKRRVLLSKIMILTLVITVIFSCVVFAVDNTVGSGTEKIVMQNTFSSNSDAVNDGSTTLPYSSTAQFRMGDTGGAGYSNEADHTGNGGGSLAVGNVSARGNGRAKFLNTVESERLLTDSDVERSFTVTLWAKAKSGTATLKYGLLAIDVMRDPSEGNVVLNENWQEITYEFTITSAMIASREYCFSVSGTNLHIDDLKIVETTFGTGETMIEQQKEEVIVKNRFIESVFGDIKDTIYEKPVSLLNALGVIQGDVDGNFNAEKEMTRAEFLEAAMRLSGYSENEASNLPVSFTDVPSAHRLLWAVRIAEDMGIISGIGGQRQFEPDEIIKTEQALKILISTMGYDYLAESMGGYPVGYLSVAAIEGISNDSNSGNVTRGAAAIMLYNATQRDIKRAKGYNVANETMFESVSDYTILTRGFGIVKKTGRVTGTPDTSLTGETGVAKGRVEIDGITYRYENSNVAKLLGLQGEFYYTEREGILEIVHISPLDSNSMLIIPSKYIISYLGGIYEYSFNDKGSFRKVTVPITSNIIYNGQFAILTPDMMKPSFGEVRLLDSDRDGIYETVFIEDINYCIVNKVNTLDWTMYNKYFLNDSQYIFDFSDASESMTVFNTSGAARQFKDIKEYDVVAVKASKGASRMVSLTVSTQKRSGTVTEIAKDTITLGEVSFDISEYFKRLIEAGKLSMPELGETVRLLTAPDGTIVGYMPSTSAAGKQYGYLVKTDATPSLDSTVQFRILTSEGNLETLNCASKISINGSSSKATEKAISELGVTGNIPRQLIGYELNSNGLVTSIETAEPADVISSGKSKNRLRQTFPKQEDKTATGEIRLIRYARFASGNGTFIGRCNVKSTTVVFWVPDTAHEDLEENSNYYYTTDISKITGSNNILYNVEGYTIQDIDNNADFLIIKSGDTPQQISDSTDIFLVTKSAVTINDEGETIRKLYGILGNKESEILINDQSYTDINGKKDIDYINPGDIIRAVAGRGGEVILLPGKGISGHANFKRLLNVYGNNGGPLMYDMTTNIAEVYIVGGLVYDIKDGYIWVDISELTPARRSIDLTGFKIYIFDENKQNFTDGQPGDINPEDFVVIRINYGTPRNIIVYKNKPVQ